MREIKFRAWDKKEKAFIPIHKLQELVLYLLSLEREGRSRNDFILMQYTGLKDKNGKEIYEGDIVKWYHGVNRKDKGVGEIIFIGGQFTLKRSYPLEVFCESRSNNVDKPLRVLGNIYENKELLQ